jgi:hypothetical protein
VAVPAKKGGKGAFLFSRPLPLTQPPSCFSKLLGRADLLGNEGLLMLMAAPKLSVSHLEWVRLALVVPLLVGLVQWWVDCGFLGAPLVNS